MDAGFLWRPAIQRYKLLVLLQSHWVLSYICERRWSIFQHSCHKLSLAPGLGKNQRSQCCRAPGKWFMYIIWPLLARRWALGNSKHSLCFIQHTAPPVGHPVCLHRSTSLCLGCPAHVPLEEGHHPSWSSAQKPWLKPGWHHSGSSDSSW